MTDPNADFQPEAYEVVTSDNRHFIMQAADPETLRRNFPVAGDDFRILSVRPVASRENLVTVYELADSLKATCSKAPHWQTLLDWARQGLIPSKRIGAKFLRFVEVDVRAKMDRNSKTGATALL